MQKEPTKRIVHISFIYSSRVSHSEPFVKSTSMLNLIQISIMNVATQALPFALESVQLYLVINFIEVQVQFT
jgi:hypothetical protein